MEKENPSATTVLLYLGLVVPPVVAVEIASRLADPRTRLVAVPSLGLGGYVVLFLVLAYLVPSLLRRRERGRAAQQWRSAALRAGAGSAMLAALWTVLHLDIEPFGVRAVVGVLAAVAAFGALLVLARREGAPGSA